MRECIGYMKIIPISQEGADECVSAGRRRAAGGEGERPRNGESDWVAAMAEVLLVIL